MPVVTTRSPLRSAPRTKTRSAAACNGLVGGYDGRDCFDNGYWYSSKSWTGATTLSNDTWHFVVANYTDAHGPYFPPQSRWVAIPARRALHGVVWRR